MENRVEDYQVRVIEEAQQLEDKHEKLLTFMDGERFKILPEAEKQRLCRQANIMSAYLDVLEERIDAFKE